MYRMTNYYLMSKELERFNDLSKKVASELEKMKVKTQELDIFWDGEANAEFLLNFNESMLSINISLEKIKRGGTFLSYALYRYQISERRIQELIDSME